MFRDALAFAGKDLLIERRSRVAAGQIIPFAFTLLLLFAFALDPERGTLERAAAGLFWVAVLLSSVLAVQRNFATESAANGGLDGLRLVNMDPMSIFLGKAMAVGLQLLLLEAVLAVGVFVLYDVSPDGAGILVLTALLATIALASAATLYGAIAAGSHGRETLMPLLLLPALGPLLLAATRASESALANTSSEAWPWLQLLALIAAGYAVAGSFLFGSLLEES